MHRPGEDYDRIDRLARNILIDYGITRFPLDMFDLCKKMGFIVVPYSSYEKNEEALQLLLKKSKDGFYFPACNGMPPQIIYNDKYGDHLTPARIQSTLGHEIKHILEEDTTDEEDDLCDHFARYLRCPIPIVIHLGLSTEMELISYFQISSTQAQITLSSVWNRTCTYGNQIFPDEKELLETFIDTSSNK
ncbi:MAG: hypothetical protein IJ120_02135 [Solobacterium sp.]|nr:hypothetical protein [Solobacterium sp.]